jgi:hypothetical protein
MTILLAKVFENIIIKSQKTTKIDTGSFFVIC